jgi:hypothetical protein
MTRRGSATVLFRHHGLQRIKQMPRQLAGWTTRKCRGNIRRPGTSTARPGGRAADVGTEEAGSPGSPGNVGDIINGREAGQETNEQRCCGWLLTSRDQGGVGRHQADARVPGRDAWFEAGERHRRAPAAPGCGIGPLGVGAGHHPGRAGAGGPLVRVLHRRAGPLRGAFWRGGRPSARKHRRPAPPWELEGTGRRCRNREEADRPGLQSGCRCLGRFWPNLGLRQRIRFIEI